MTSPATGVHVLYVHFHQPVDGDHPPLPDLLDLLDLLTEVTPTVQALPPDAALVDVRGALRYFDRDAVQLAGMIRVRALARYGVDCTIGVAVNPLLARMVAQDGPPGAVRTLPDTPEDITAFLADKPAATLYGVGPATVRTLSRYGLDRVGQIAATPPGTLQRLLGATAGRRLHERARGLDLPTFLGGGPGGSASPVRPGAPARSTSAEHRFPHDELDPDQRRRALLTLADVLGLRMRTDDQVARALTLTVRYADRSTTTRRRTLPEPTAHTLALTTTAYALHDALALQRARVRGLTLRAEELTAAELASHQLSFDVRDERARRAEAAADRARSRFGAHAVGPAGGLGRHRLAELGA